MNFELISTKFPLPKLIWFRERIPKVNILSRDFCHVSPDHSAKASPTFNQSPDLCAFKYSLDLWPVRKSVGLLMCSVTIDIDYFYHLLKSVHYRSVTVRWLHGQVNSQNAAFSLVLGMVCIFFNDVQLPLFLGRYVLNKF